MTALSAKIARVVETTKQPLYPASIRAYNLAVKQQVGRGVTDNRIKVTGTR
jgi:hypothetical protein